MLRVGELQFLSCLFIHSGIYKSSFIYQVCIKKLFCAILGGPSGKESTCQSRRHKLDVVYEKAMGNHNVKVTHLSQPPDVTLTPKIYPT